LTVPQVSGSACLFLTFFEFRRKEFIMRKIIVTICLIGMVVIVSGCTEVTQFSLGTAYNVGVALPVNCAWSCTHGLLTIGQKEAYKIKGSDVLLPWYYFSQNEFAKDHFELLK